MKSINWVLFWLMVSPLLTNGQWIVQDPGFPEDYEIGHIQALSKNHVWVSANDMSSNRQHAMYSVTLDGGTTWQTDTIEGASELKVAMIFGFGSIPPAYAVLYKSGETSASLPGIYYTGNYGASWSRKEGAFDHPESFPDIIHFWSEGSRGVAIGDPIDGEFEIYSILDYGNSMTRVASENIPDPLPDEFAIVRTYGVSGNTIWFSTTRGRVFRSDDEGLNWTAYSTLFDSHTRILVTDPDIVYLQELPDWETTRLASTIDGAYSWDIINYNGRLLSWDLKKIPNRNIFVSSGAYLHNGFSFSRDQGQNWHSMNDTDKFFVMDWYNSVTGWAGGETETTNRGTKPIIYKYNGPGIGSYYASTLKYDFGEVDLNEIVTFDLTLTNNGNEPVEITDIISFAGEFFTGISSCTIEPYDGQCVVNVAFAPGSADFFEGDMTIFSNNPDLPEITITLSGSGVQPAAPFTFDPYFFNETMVTGEKKTIPLNFINESPFAFGWQAEVDYDLPLQTLGWQNGSTPLGADDGILGASPDWAIFVKDIKLETDFTGAILRLGFDDGIRVWVNGTLVLDDLYADNPVGYWNQEVDITEWMVQGTNRIAVVVFNGVFNGGGDGGFDCELDVDGQLLIKRGDENYGSPEARWFYYGEISQQLTPPKDMKERNWWEKDYGNYQWLLLNQYQYDSSGEQFDGLGWVYESAPFGSDELLLNNSPDNAYFIKDVEITTHDEATLFLSFDDGCLVYINGNLAFDYQYDDHGSDYWNEELDVSGLLTEGRNRISIVVFNGVYGGFGTGYFDCQLLVDGMDIIKRGDFYYGEPEAFWQVYGQGGMVLTPPVDYQGYQWYDMNYALGKLPLTSSLGWAYNSTPVNGNENLLYLSPDNAQFIKDIQISEYSNATLYLGFDDGCKVWINGTMEFDFHYDVHGMNYWDYELDVSEILLTGRNRIAIEVYNGIFGGAGAGGFDCQLIVDETEIIKRGDLYFEKPEAMWFMYGEPGKILTPPEDANGLAWYHKDYGLAGSVSSVFAEGIIQNWETDQLMVLFDAKGLTEDDYWASIRFTNTGTMEVFKVPVDLHITGGAKIAVNPTTLDYGDYFIGFPETQKMKITNLGNETLEIFNVYPLHPNISLVWDEYYIEPGQSIYTEITIEPFDVGFFNSSLVIECNDPLNPFIFVTISAETSNAPDIEIPNVEYLFAQLEPNQTEVQNFPVYNFGDDPSVLSFTIPQAIENKSLKSTGVKVVPVTHSGKNLSSDIPERNHKVERNNKDIIGFKDCSIKDPDKMNKNGNDSIIYYDNMENSKNGWSIENYQNTEAQWHQVNFNSNSPDHAWWCGNELTGTYWNGNTVSEAIVSPSIKLPPWGYMVILEFSEFYIVEEWLDHLNVEISNDGGENWWLIREGVSGWSENWVTTSLDISDFAGSEIRIRFLFDTYDGFFNDFPGWFIDDVKIYSPGFPFISISPGQASLQSWEYQEMNVTFDATGYEPGFYFGYFLILSNDPDEPYYYLPAQMDVSGEPLPHLIDLPQGWSGLSSYIIPSAQALEDVFAPISNELIIAQTMTGMYFPGQNINTIGNWEGHSAYKVKTLEGCTLSFTGNYETNMTVSLNAGWNLLPVVTHDGAPAADLLSPINGFVIAKDVAGTGIYWPEFEINTLGYLEPGKAYFLLLTEDGVVDYSGYKSNFTGSKNLSASIDLTAFNILATPISHTIAIFPSAIEAFKPGTLIGTYNQAGNCFGITKIGEGNNSITIFGDDPTTAEKDGFYEGEMVSFKNLTGFENLVGLEPTFYQNLPQSDGLFTENGLSAITSFNASAGIAGVNFFQHVTIFPNPSDGLVNISGIIPGTALTVTDLQGKVLIEKIADSENTEFDLTDYQSGVYFIKISQNGTNIFRKIVLR